ncbi:hypothetical protein F5144DRAFT_381522 [Chaetomium tenue]|uniref:Uncharacterized protein n=1 Tax=Chaetomium tenue TaxID=1854479 RepID=A0ACB7NWE2_9PEZI|nr:hypothetical protein F5144DRAFT_381522 [Chaetomium globosum]
MLSRRETEQGSSGFHPPLSIDVKPGRLRRGLASRRTKVQGSRAPGREGKILRREEGESEAFALRTVTTTTTSPSKSLSSPTTIPNPRSLLKRRPLTIRIPLRLRRRRRRIQQARSAVVAQPIDIEEALRAVGPEAARPQRGTALDLVEADVTADEAVFPLVAHFSFFVFLVVFWWLFGVFLGFVVLRWCDLELRRGPRWRVGLLKLSANVSEL